VRLTDVETAGRPEGADKAPCSRLRAAATVVTLLLAYVGLAIGTPMNAERFSAKPAGVQQGLSTQHVAIREAAGTVRVAKRNKPSLGAGSPSVAANAVVQALATAFGTGSRSVGVVPSIPPSSPYHGFRARAPPAVHA
jgi:hypothetical protein